MPQSRLRLYQIKMLIALEHLTTPEAKGEVFNDFHVPEHSFIREDVIDLSCETNMPQTLPLALQAR